MHKFLIALAAASLVGLAGCQGGGMATKQDTPAQPAKPAISEDASKALTQAEADVKSAKSKNALWTTAADELKKAQDAAAKGDSAAVIKHAKTASDHAKLGIEQTKYPLTK